MMIMMDNYNFSGHHCSLRLQSPFPFSSTGMRMAGDFGQYEQRSERVPDPFLPYRHFDTYPQPLDEYHHEGIPLHQKVDLNSKYAYADRAHPNNPRLYRVPVLGGPNAPTHVVDEADQEWDQSWGIHIAMVWILAEV